MYLPTAFAETDLAALDALIARDNFITLVTVDDGSPVVSHLPVLYQRVNDAIQLTGHWSRANPQSRHAGAALAIVHGPHAYVSPSWYPDKESASRVPTWNYATAHLQGELQTFRDEAELGALVGALTRQHESRIGSHWVYDHAREELRRQLGGITGFRLVVTAVQLKFKLNQNHPLGNRRAVASQLAQQASPSSHDISELMRARMPAHLGED
ncbi:MAG TPA: FMN-binding negative transcriptional regulator [Luteimonas sp.]|nr:FMN-binding negative transcriptional regulator [Luteimonas sp.]